MEELRPDFEHPSLGKLKWDPLMDRWIATTDLPLIRNKEIGIRNVHLDKNLALVTNFLRWVQLNYRLFIAHAAYEAFNRDLVWGENIDHAQLAAKLTIDSLTAGLPYDPMLFVWLDAGGATTDHLIVARLNERHKVTAMDLC